MSKKLYKSYYSIRRLPKNIEEVDTEIFNHELKRYIQPTFIKNVHKVVAFNEIIVSLSSFTYFKKYTFFGDKTFLERVKRIIKRYLMSNKKTLTIDKGIWFTDHKSHVFFHWIFDSLMRAEASIDYNKEYPLIVPEKFYNQSFIKDSLDHLNLNFIVMKDNQLYRIKDLLLVTKTSLTGNYNEKILDKLKIRFTKNMVKQELNFNQNLFIYRKKGQSRAIHNFEELKPIIAKYGYQLIQFEDYTFNQKINLLSNCKNLVGVFGSGLSSMLFLPQGAKIAEIRQKGDYKNNAYFSLASSLKLDYYYQFYDLIDNKISLDPKTLDNLLKELN
jgi:capsular polysaccharide biosynthesis protein